MDFAQLKKRFKINEGDLVRVKVKNNSFEGFFVGQKDENFFTLKLKSGYNIELLASQKMSIEILKGKKIIGMPKQQKISFNNTLPTASFLHTGGTIASRVDYKTGGALAGLNPKDLVQMYPELQKIANFRTKFVANLMSEDLGFEDYSKIIKAIKDELKKDIKGIIVAHGTDTLAYTSAALAFAFENLGIPIILVGSQRSSDRGSSDAAMNLVCAAEFISKTDFAGVAICMHDSSADDFCAILPATKSRKMHTSRRDAFKAINSQPIAKINYKTRETIYLTKDYTRKPSEKIVIKEKFEQKVGILKTHPNMLPKEIEFFTKNKYKGMVIEGTGVGHAPTNSKKNQKNYLALKNFIKKDGIAVMTSQCLFGRVHPTIYANTRRLANIGVIFGEDMLPETAFIKLAWLLGNFPKKKAKELVTKNLRGEIKERTHMNEFELEGLTIKKK